VLGLVKKRMIAGFSAGRRRFRAADDADGRAEGTTWLEPYGRAVRQIYKTLTPGLGFIMPYVDSVGRKLNVMEQVIDVPSQEIITKDNASVKVDGVAFYSVVDPRRASYEVSNLQQALLNLVMTNIRTVMGSSDLDQLLSHRDEINVRLLNVIDAASHPGASR
jgi:regulator of protease activity HflC (stomatin/prohibitin superfamily)